MNLAERTFNSATLMIIASVVKQSIGLVSMVVLARLLSPTDYGIVAISMLVIHFFDVLAQTGTTQYVLSRKNLHIDALQTAWTLQLTVRGGLAILVMLASGTIGEFFETPELQAVLIVSAFVPILNSLQAPGLMLLRREFDYRSIALIIVASKILATIAAVSIAVLLHSYWAFVVGDLVLAASLAAFSYRAHSLRPRLSLSGWRRQWGFSKWMLARAIVGFTRSKVDNLFVGKLLGATEIGAYSFSMQIALLPQEHLTKPLVDIFTSSITRAREDTKSVADTLTKLLATQVSLLLPIVVATTQLAELLVEVVLGPSWDVAAPIVQALASVSLSVTIAGTLSVALVAMERVRLTFAVDVLCSLIVVAVVAFILFGSAELRDLAIGRAALASFIAMLFYFVVSTLLPLNHLRLVSSILPAIIASVVMWLAIDKLESGFSNSHGIIRLLATGSGGMLVYAAVYCPILYLRKNHSPETIYMQKTLNRVIDRLGGLAQSLVKSKL